MPYSLESIVKKYDGLIIDLWGVVHDGTALYDGAKEALAFLHEHRLPVVFLSNAPRVAAKAIERLDALGIPRVHYIDCITSGQVAYDWLKNFSVEGGLPPFAALPLRGSPTATQPTPALFRYYYLGPSKDEDILHDLPNYQRVTNTLEADFILNTGYQVDFQPHEEIIPLLKKLVAEEKPLLCVNPDRDVVKQDGTHMLCAGTLAAEYEKLGGRVTYVGKPHARVYEVCRKLLPKGRLLAIGDNPLTDIKGGNDARIDTMLITGGVLSVQHNKLLDAGEALAVCIQSGARADYVLPGFALSQ